MQDGCKVYLDSYPHGIQWIMFHGHVDYFQKPPLEGRSDTNLGDHGTPNAPNHWFILFHHVWGPAWIKIHWHSIWLRAWSHTTSHYTWGSVTTLHDCGGVLGRPLDTFFWALTISWSGHLAHVWSGPKKTQRHWIMGTTTTTLSVILEGLSPIANNACGITREIFKTTGISAIEAHIAGSCKKKNTIQYSCD